MNQYIPKTEQYALLGPAGQIAAIELAQKGFKPVMLVGEKLHSLIGPSSSIRLCCAKAQAPFRLEGGHEFQKIRKAVELTPVKSGIIGIESRMDKETEQVYLTRYKIKWYCRLWARL